MVKEILQEAELEERAAHRAMALGGSLLHCGLAEKKAGLLVHHSPSPYLTQPE